MKKEGGEKTGARAWRTLPHQPRSVVVSIVNTPFPGWKEYFKLSINIGFNI